MGYGIADQILIDSLCYSYKYMGVYKDSLVNYIFWNPALVSRQKQSSLSLIFYPCPDSQFGALVVDVLVW